MKKSAFFFSLIAMGLSMVHAESLYTITLHSGERFTNCTIKYKNDDSTEFSGKDSSGKEISKKVAQSDILNMREETGEDAANEQQAPADSDATAQSDTSAPTVTDGNIAQREGEDKAADATLRLREKLARIDSEMAKISNPSKALTSQTKNVKSRVSNQLADLDKRALEIAKLQDEFNKAGAADYTFDKVSAEDRDRYMRDGEAAYKAMKIDMKEKKGRRKVGGLDKFEIMRERYQGMPEYKSAHEWYIKTLYSLQKKWTRMYDRESASRKRLAPDRRNAMNKLDERQYNELADKLNEDGDDIATVWFVPQNRNLKMLSICVNKVKDAIRRNERNKLDPAVGTVPSLLRQFWNDMDKVRMNMVTGNLEAAEKQIGEIPSYNLIMRLKQQLLPNEYRDPLREQYRDAQKEITKRIREYRRLKTTLERSIAVLDRNIASAEAQIDSALTAVQKELDSDVGENTMQVVQEKEATQDEAAADSTATAQ